MCCIKIQNGKPKLIAYASKRLSEAAKHYSITELELCGLVINIASFSHLLKRVDFDAVVDHLSLTHIIKSKAEPATARIKRLLELISYSFNLYYIKEKPCIGQGIARFRRRTPDPINQPSFHHQNCHKKIPGEKNNRNRKNKPCKFHRSNVFCKQSG